MVSSLFGNFLPSSSWIGKSEISQLERYFFKLIPEEVQEVHNGLTMELATD